MEHCYLHLLGAVTTILNRLFCRSKRKPYAGAEPFKSALPYMGCCTPSYFVTTPPSHALLRGDLGPKVCMTQSSLQVPPDDDGSMLLSKLKSSRPIISNKPRYPFQLTLILSQWHRNYISCTNFSCTNFSKEIFAI